MTAASAATWTPNARCRPSPSLIPGTSRHLTRSLLVADAMGMVS